MPFYCYYSTFLTQGSQVPPECTPVQGLSLKTTLNVWIIWLVQIFLDKAVKKTKDDQRHCETTNYNATQNNPPHHNTTHDKTKQTNTNQYYTRPHKHNNNNKKMQKKQRNGKKWENMGRNRKKTQEMGEKRRI